MQSMKRALLYGVGVWVLLTLVSVILFSLEKQDTALFESIKFIALVAVALGFSVAYLKKLKQSTIAEGLAVGSLWLVIVVALDLVLYAFGLFNLSLADYFKDVASSYLVLPLVAGTLMHYLKRK